MKLVYSNSLSEDDHSLIEESLLLDRARIMSELRDFRTDSASFDDSDVKLNRVDLSFTDSTSPIPRTYLLEGRVLVE